ncbi:MAG: type II toxin-antitoxin system RelE/ParE family toxin [Bryobacteraceae bacterium]
MHAPGKGKSGGFRTLIVFRAGSRAFFVHGFAKNEKENIEKNELTALKKLASELLAYDDKTIARVVASGTLVEVKCDEKAIS